MTIKLCIIAIDTKGLANDVHVLRLALLNCSGELQSKLKIHQRLISTDSVITTILNPQDIPLDEKPDVVIHVEQILDTPYLKDSNIFHILVPNPEWLSPVAESRVVHMDQIWHKTRASFRLLKDRFPAPEHVFIGFSSLSPDIRVDSYRSFAHFKGKAIARNSDKILNIWKRRPDLPELKFHFYSNDLNFFQLPEWFRWKNVSIKIGFLPSETYFAELVDTGIHLCTSEVEGFGHYINEARAMHAVPVVIDAPPMNELVDSESGILIRPTAKGHQFLGERYIASEQDIEAAVDEVKRLDESRLRHLGTNAHARYVRELNEFIVRLEQAFARVIGVLQA